MPGRVAQDKDALGFIPEDTRGYNLWRRRSAALGMLVNASFKSAGERALERPTAPPIASQAKYVARGVGLVPRESTLAASVTSALIAEKPVVRNVRI